MTLAKKRKKKATVSKKKTSLSPEMVIIIMLIVGILLGVLIYTGAGQVGAVLSPLFGGLLGIIKYIIPVGIVVTALSLMKEDSDYVTTKLTQFVIFIVCISVVMHVHQFSKATIAGNATFEEIVNEAYKLGTMNKGGGAIGAIVATPLTNMIGSLGTMVLTIAIAVIACMYLVGVNPVEFLIEFIDGREDRKEEKRARREEQRQAFNERMEERRKNRATVHEAQPKVKEPEPKNDQVELMQDEIVINHFNDKPHEDDKKSKFSLFGKKDKDEVPEKMEPKKSNPDELENIFKEVFAKISEFVPTTFKLSPSSSNKRPFKIGLSSF